MSHPLQLSLLISYFFHFKCNFQVEVFRRLVDKHGARLDALTTRKSGLLHVTCEAGSLDMAKLLLDEYRQAQERAIA